MAVPTTPAEIAASLTMDQIPVKLRCAACTQLASNAFRMPCCDQSICETCQQSLDDACPICLHEPVKADDCKINKALRNTIKAFLRKKGIERDQALKKEMASRAPATPATSDNANTNEAPDHQASRTFTAPAGGLAEPSIEPPPGSREVSEIPKSTDEPEQKTGGQRSSSEAQMDIPRPSIESGNADVQTINGGDQADRTSEKLEHAGKEEQNQQEPGAPDGQQNPDQMSKLQEQWAAMNESMQGMNNGGFGYDGILGGFPNMVFNNSTDYTQMMQYMQSGMQNDMMGVFPSMMSTPGMGINPMAMAQGMYGGYNGQGMGMNGMNAGMGYANGQGTYGGYNGQPASWNGGQHNYNQNAYGGHANGMVGDYGSNAGYGGYNMTPHQGNFNQMNHRNFPNNEFQNGHHGQGYQTRGRGRGRGYQNYGRGRGGYNQVTPGHQANHEAFQHQLPSQVSQQGFDQQTASQQEQQGEQPQAEVAPQRDAEADRAEAQKTADDFSKSLDPGDAEDHIEVPTTPMTKEEPSAAAAEDNEPPSRPEQPLGTESHVQEEAHEKPSPIETFIPSEPQGAENIKSDSGTAASTAMLPPPSPVIPTGPAALSLAEQSQLYDYGSRGRGRGYHGGSVGHRGGSRGRGTGHLSNGTSVHAQSAQSALAPPLPLVTPTEPKGLGVEGAPKGPKAMREGLPSNAINGGKGFSIVGRASAAAQARTYGHTRSRSPSPTRSRSRSPTRSHRHRHHRHRSTDSSQSSDRDRKRERHHRRSRRYDDEDFAEEQNSKAADSSKRRSSHRHRDDNREKEPGRSSHRSHRAHRDRSKERDGEHRALRKRSRSLDVDVDRSQNVNGATHASGAPHVNGTPPTGPKADRNKSRDEDTTQSGRKKREREDDDEYDRERKRSKPDEHIENEDDRRSTKRAYREDASKSLHKASQSSQDMVVENSQQPPTPKLDTDPHTLEREARNRERMQKELQRRSAVDTQGSGPKRKMSGAVAGGRRVSYKYEDEESSEARTSRVESEREASRWG